MLVQLSARRWEKKKGTRLVGGGNASSKVKNPQGLGPEATPGRGPGGRRKEGVTVQRERNVERLKKRRKISQTGGRLWC